MTLSQPFVDFVQTTPIILFAGAMGTELQRRGYETRLPLWSAQANLDAEDLVCQIHKDYFNAGADTCITNTFRTTPRTFRHAGREAEAHDALKRAVNAAHKARKNIVRPVFIGGSFAPLEDCYRPDLVPGDQELADEHGQLAEWLHKEDVDFLLPETINAGREAVAMARAASATGLPFIISFVVESNGTLLDGTSITEAVESTDLPGRVAVSLNCRPIDIIDPAFNRLHSIYKGPIGLYPNGLGHPHDDQGWIFENNEDSIQKFVSKALAWKKAGAKIIGGCCGTTPDYIRALDKVLRP